LGKELLVPADSPKKLRGEFIFRLEVVGERVGVGKPGNRETGFETFRPQLPVVPGKADVLAEKALVVIADVASERQGPHRLRPEISAVAPRETESPHLVRPESDAAAHRWMIEIRPRDRARFLPTGKQPPLDLAA